MRSFVEAIIPILLTLLASERPNKDFLSLSPSPLLPIHHSQLPVSSSSPSCFRQDWQPDGWYVPLSCDCLCNAGQTTGGAWQRELDGAARLSNFTSPLPRHGIVWCLNTWALYTYGPDRANDMLRLAAAASQASSMLQSSTAMSK